MNRAMNTTRIRNPHGAAARRTALTMTLAVSLLLPAAREPRAEDPLAVCATTPDVASLLGVVGGDRVSITTFVKPREDPHFAEAKPSFVKALNGCALYVQNGLELEAGYAPTLLQNARNPDVLPGAKGFLDLSSAIAPRDVPATVVDRSMGDVHPFGNPHHLLDPLNGLAAARLIAEKLGELRPDGRATFAENLARFESDLYRRVVGEDLARKYGGDVVKLAVLFERGKLVDFLRDQGEASRLGGWLGAMAPHYGAQVVQDHLVWPYFAGRFGLRIAGSLEPKPGIPPTTKHMSELIEKMRADGVRIVLASAYYDPRYAELVAEKSGARVLPMANQVGAVAGTDTYLEMIDYDVRQVAGALGPAT